MPAVGVRVLVALLLGACLLGACLVGWVVFFLPSGSCRLSGFMPDGGTTVGFDLRKVLANVPGPVVVWACLEENCVRHIGSSYRWTYFYDTNAALTDPETVDVRLVVRDRGRVVFDQATRLDQFDESQPNGPGCEPTFFNGEVLATPEGDLIQLIPQ